MILKAWEVLLNAGLMIWDVMAAFDPWNRRRDYGKWRKVEPRSHLRYAPRDDQRKEAK